MVGIRVGVEVFVEVSVGLTRVGVAVGWGKSSGMIPSMTPSTSCRVPVAVFDGFGEGDSVLLLDRAGVSVIVGRTVSVSRFPHAVMSMERIT